MTNNKIRLGLLVLLNMVILSSCSSINLSHHTPEDWVTLANSGLAGRDNYGYTVHLETGLNQGVTLKTVQFNGQVKSHHEYSVNTESMGAKLLHPAQYMDIINNNNNVVSYIQEGLDVSAKSMQLKLEVKEDNETATIRWRNLLRQQYEQLKLSSLNMTTDPTKQNEIQQLLASSQEKLEAMLATLQVESKFRINVNTQDAIPEAIDEYVVLTYMKDEKKMSEYRKCTIKLNY